MSWSVGNKASVGSYKLLDSNSYTISEYLFHYSTIFSSFYCIIIQFILLFIALWCNKFSLIVRIKVFFLEYFLVEAQNHLKPLNVWRLLFVSIELSVTLITIGKSLIYSISMPSQTLSHSLQLPWKKRTTLKQRLIWINDSPTIHLIKSFFISAWDCRTLISKRCKSAFVAKCSKESIAANVMEK